MFIDLLIKDMPKRWDEIIAKYGVRIHNGDKIGGSFRFVDNSGFHIIADGVGDRGHIDVTIEAADVIAYRIPAHSAEWVDVKPGTVIVV